MLEAIPFRRRREGGGPVLSGFPLSRMSGGDAVNEAVIRKHAATSGFPATKITEVKRVIGPMTAAAA
jgi:hypothetical protein